MTRPGGATVSLPPAARSSRPYRSRNGRAYTWQLLKDKPQGAGATTGDILVWAMVGGGLQLLF